MTTFETLVDAVGEDAAVSVRLWLSDIVEKHTLSADGRTISPSCGWLLDAISPHPTPVRIDGQETP